MSYTGNCIAAGGDCPGGPEQCLLDPQPIDPEICAALEGIEDEEDDGEGEPPGGPG